MGGGERDRPKRNKQKLVLGRVGFTRSSLLAESRERVRSLGRDNELSGNQTNPLQKLYLNLCYLEAPP